MVIKKSIVWLQVKSDLMANKVYLHLNYSLFALQNDVFSLWKQCFWLSKTPFLHLKTMVFVVQKTWITNNNLLFHLFLLCFVQKRNVKFLHFFLTFDKGCYGKIEVNVESMSKRDMSFFTVGREGWIVTTGENEAKNC